ncbi:hypothetical protein [Sphingobium sp. DC-2]|uniref:hypothetical protein n=1 Tax=Sphingobium sp. DC-2 TaxID=1303256 RepID=UPI0004C2C95A|nr:hypothetical protein [Sphingobium sp. DC-2]
MAEEPHDDQEDGSAHIAGISEDGISVMIDGEQRLMGWSAVSGITSGVSKRDDNMVFVAIAIDAADGERSLLVAQDHPIWTELVELLHLCLPVAPLEAWAAGTAAFPGAYTLYRRPTVG